MHCNYVATPHRRRQIRRGRVASIRCTATTLLLGSYTHHRFDAQVASTRCTATTLLLPRICFPNRPSDVASIRCTATTLLHAVAIIQSLVQTVASIRCTATTLLHHLPVHCNLAWKLHLSDALQLRYYATEQTGSLWHLRCIYPMHCNYVATKIIGLIAFLHQLHLSDALQLRCYQDMKVDDFQCNRCIYPMHCNYVATIGRFLVETFG